MNSRLSFLTDFIVFQLAWFACVLATLSPIPNILPLLGLGLVSIRTFWVRPIGQVLPLAIACLVLGILGDAILVSSNLLLFSTYPTIAGAPLWMVALWVNFGLMLRPLFTWFLDHYWRSIIGFSLGGVVAYYSGEKLGVLTFSNGFESWIGVALEWAIAGLVLRYLHLKFPLPE
tara:strand:+ start:28 stop:549 length:522 start_codon:yes stop_codon:yes gene_type:complete